MVGINMKNCINVTDVAKYKNRPDILLRSTRMAQSLYSVFIETYTRHLKIIQAVNVNLVRIREQMQFSDEIRLARM